MFRNFPEFLKLLLWNYLTSRLKLAPFKVGSLFQKASVVCCYKESLIQFCLQFFSVLNWGHQD